MQSLASKPLSEGMSSLLPNLEGFRLPEGLSTRKARIQDVPAISTLINEFAAKDIMLARGPLYLYQNIQDYRVASTAFRGKETLLACGGLHVLWEDLAEVRSVAVHPALKRLGLGRRMVMDLIQDARGLGASRIMTFTLAPEFFSALGFRTIDRETLPPVVWSACSGCSKFYRCDEITMMLEEPFA